MLTLALRERVAEGRVRGFCAAATGTAITGQYWNNLVPKLQLGNVNAIGSSASMTQSWSFSSDCIPKLELGNEKLGT